MYNARLRRFDVALGMPTNGGFPGSLRIVSVRSNVEDNDLGIYSPTLDKNELVFANLVWVPPNATPPFWTMFNRAVEVGADAGWVSSPEQDLEPAPGPDPDPDPDPTTEGLPMVLVAGGLSGEGLPSGVGYIPFFDVGSLTPRALSYLGTHIEVVAFVYDTEFRELTLLTDVEGLPNDLPVYIEGVGVVTLLQTAPTDWVCPLEDAPFVIGSTYNLLLQVDGVEAVDPVPDPDPGNAFADFVLTAGQQSLAAGVFTGFGTGDFGALNPDEATFGGVPITIDGVYAGDDLVLYIDMFGVYGVTGGVIIVNGVEVILSDPPYIDDNFVSLSATIDAPLFEIGETYNIRIYLEGDLSSEAPSPGPDGYDTVIDLVMEAGGLNNIAGYEYDYIGSIEPDSFDIGGFDALLYMLLEQSPEGIMVDIHGVYGATRAAIEVDGNLLEFDEVVTYEYGLFLALQDVSEVFEVGESYNIKLHLAGDWRGEP